MTPHPGREESAAAATTPRCGTGGASAYQRGKTLERRVRQTLERHGYVVVRSGASGSPADLWAARPGLLLLLQVKRSGVLPPAEWNALLSMAGRAGAVPVLVAAPPRRPLQFWRLTGPKVTRQRNPPREPFEPGVPREE